MTQTGTNNRLLPADFQTKLRGDGQIEITATDDMPSVLGVLVVLPGAAETLMKQLAETLGATVVTAGQQQDLGQLFRDMISAADDRDNALGATPSFAMLNAHRDAMRDLRDTFRRADIISG